MVDAPVDFFIRVPRALCAELPYRPVFTVFCVEEFDEGVCWVAVCAFGIGGRGAGGCDY